MERVAFRTLGCKVNQYETEAMEKLFRDADYSIVPDEESADIYVINTCTVTNLSARKSRQFIRQSKKLNKDALIAVVGCYSQVAPDEIEAIKDIDVIIGTNNRGKIVELCEEAKNKDQTINIVRDRRTYKKYESIDIDNIESKTRAYIKIQDGCNQYCSYCIIPYARGGAIRSRGLDGIIPEVENLVEKGFKEIVLTGIHVASYGRDLSNTNLGQAIEKIGSIDGLERIRLSSIEPNLIDNAFMKSLVKTNKVCDHFHLSLQSGSNTILKRMNRKYTKEEYKTRVDLIRKYMPNAGITTDIIVGFPGETEEEFNQTLEFVKEIGFSRIHVFKYSPRKGTPAAKFENQINGNTKNKRSKTLIELGDKMTETFNQKFIDSNMEILYEVENNKESSILEGYTTNYIRVKTPLDKRFIGNIVNTHILNKKNGFLIGESRR